MTPTDDADANKRAQEILDSRPSITPAEARALFPELSDRQFQARMRSAEALARQQAEVRAFNELAAKS